MASTSAKKQYHGIVVPHLPNHLTPLDDPVASFRDKKTTEQAEIIACEVTGQTAYRVHFSEVRFTHLLAAESHFEEMRLVDVRIQEANLANALWVKLDCYRTEFTNCRMTGMSLMESTIHDTIFRDCKGDYVQFHHAVLHAVRFEECPLICADFRETDATGVVFHRCDLTNTDFTGAILRNADLRGCPIEGMRVGPKELHGAIIDEVQALALVRSMGITIA
jgi:uncharacterized protein YjbI with pentapeptide repeats